MLGNTHLNRKHRLDAALVKVISALAVLQDKLWENEIRSQSLHLPGGLCFPFAAHAFWTENPAQN